MEGTTLMAAPIRFNNEYLITALYECQQMTHKMTAEGISVSKNYLFLQKSYQNYQIVSPTET